MGRWLPVAVAVVMTACGLMPAATPRTISDTGVTFRPTPRDANSVTREAAMQAVRAGWQLPAQFDAEHGIATCPAEHPGCVFGSFLPPRGRAIWLIQWGSSAYVIVDAATGEVIIGS